jgi:hypothetical protein
MDHPLAEGISGVLPYMVEAETPIFVRGADRENFARLPDGTFALPGSTIRGAVRSVVEIASFAKMAPTRVNDRRYGVRDLQNRALYGEHMASILNGEPTPLVSAGWLRRRIDDEEFPAEIEPCNFAKVDYGLIEGYARENGRAGFDPGRRRRGAPDKYRDWCRCQPDDPGFLRALEVAFSVRVRRQGNAPGAGWLGDYGVVEALGRGPDRGTLVFTGQPSPWVPNQPKRPGAGNPKHHDFVFWGAAAAAEGGLLAPLPIPKATLEDFEFIHADTGQQHRASVEPNAEWRFWRPRFEAGERVPVFFILEVDEQKQPRRPLAVRSLGLAMMFRLAYRRRIQEAIRNAQPSCDDGRPDLAELLFGRATEREGAAGYRGRVSFGPARAKEKVEPLGRVTAVLSAPRASYYPNYVLQTSTNPAGDRLQAWRGTPEYRTYMDDDVQIRGWKRYRIQERADLTPPIPQKANEKVQTAFRPLPEKTRFEGNLRIHNVLPAELGAILWALDFGGDKAARHAIGLAKPYGFGRARIAVDESAAASLVRNDGQPVDLAACRAAFVALMEDFARREGIRGGWAESEQIVSLIALARPVSRATEDCRYPRLDHEVFRNEFVAAKRERLVLPPPIDRPAWERRHSPLQPPLTARPAPTPANPAAPAPGVSRPAAAAPPAEDPADVADRNELAAAFAQGQHIPVLRRWMQESGPREAVRKAIAKDVVNFISKRMKKEAADVVAWMQG